MGVWQDVFLQKISLKIKTERIRNEELSGMAECKEIVIEQMEKIHVKCIDKEGLQN